MVPAIPLVDSLEAIAAAIANAFKHAAIDPAPTDIIAALVIALSNRFEKGSHALAPFSLAT